MQLTLPLLGGHSLGPLCHQPVTRAAKPRIRGERRRRLLKRRTPAWADRAAIAAVYRQARAQRASVDHIIPLHHPLVSGLHVGNNLCVRCTLDNSRRRNTGWWPDAPFEQVELL